MIHVLTVVAWHTGCR